MTSNAPGPVVIRRLPADTPIPEGSTRYSEPLVAVSNQLWLLLATRRHPATGEFNALLKGIDDRCMAVVPAWAIANFTSPDIELAKHEAGIQPEPPPAAPRAPVPGQPITGMDLVIDRFCRAFDGTPIHTEEPIHV